MTGRVCEVHGEYAADGICRWCEKPSGADQSSIWLPPLCMCQKCGRGFEAPVPLTSLLCPECRGVPVVVDPHMSSDAPPVLVSWTLIEKTDEAYGWRLEWTAPVPPGPELNADKERRLAGEHAALRWERVARRWNHKHQSAGGLDERDRRRVWMHWLDQMHRRHGR